MQVSRINKTTLLIRSIVLMKSEELLECKLKINALEVALEEDYSSINVYKYRQANQRFNNLKSTIFTLIQLELRINKKNKNFLGQL